MKRFDNTWFYKVTLLGQIVDFFSDKLINRIFIKTHSNIYQISVTFPDKEIQVETVEEIIINDTACYTEAFIYDEKLTLCSYEEADVLFNLSEDDIGNEHMCLISNQLTIGLNPDLDIIENYIRFNEIQSETVNVYELKEKIHF